MQKAEEILDAHKKLVWSEIDEYLHSPNYPKAFKIPNDYKKLDSFHWQIVKDYPLRKGKYLRPTLLLLTAKALGVNEKKALKVAAAMQLSEEWLLVHDDIEDGSLLRRGDKTLHKKYGVELAVNAGDTLQTIMMKFLIDSLDDLGEKTFKEVVKEFYLMILRTELGQSVEIKWFKENKIDFVDKDWFFIADSKSSYYSIAGPIRLGALIAGVSEKKLEDLSKFGLGLGKSWQLIDDILDVTSDFNGLKQKGNDIYEGKRTVILGHLLRNAKPVDKQRLITIMQKRRREKTKREILWVIEKMNDYHSIEYARNMALKYKDEAIKTFDKDLKFLSQQPERDQLRTLISFIVEREY